MFLCTCLCVAFVLGINCQTTPGQENVLYKLDGGEINYTEILFPLTEIGHSIITNSIVEVMFQLVAPDLYTSKPTSFFFFNIWPFLYVKVKLYSEGLIIQVLNNI